jgi:hypothetical protein
MDVTVGTFNLNNLFGRWNLYVEVPETRAICRNDGGGGNRTRVRGRAGSSIYKLVLRFRFARRSARRRPADGLAVLRSPASGDRRSLGGEPVS